MSFTSSKVIPYRSWFNFEEVVPDDSIKKSVRCSLGLLFTFLIYDIMLWSIDTCQIKLSADQYHATISRVQVYSSWRACVLLKLAADQVLVFDWIAGLCRVKLLKTELEWVDRKPVISNPSFKVNQLITVSSIQMFFTENLMPWTYKTQIKIQPYPGLT